VRRWSALSLCLLALGMTGPQGHSTDAVADASQARRADVERWLEAHTDKLRPTEITAAARTLVDETSRAGLSVDLVLAVIEVESGGDPFARSRAGAIGLMQLRPSTAEETARSLGLDWQGPQSLADPVVNIRLGVAYLRKMIDRFGDVPAALNAYNRGPARIARRLAQGAPMPKVYVQRVEDAFGGPLERGVYWL